MWHEIVSSLDSTLQVMIVSTVEAWALHPFFASVIVFTLMILAAMLWLELLDVRENKFVAFDAQHDVEVRL